MYINHASGPTRRVVVIVVLIALVAIGTASLVTASEHSGEVIYACVNNDSGKTKIIAAATECRNNWTLVHWNQHGPPGADGLDGADGEDGVSGYEEVMRFWPDIVIASGELVSLQTWCPADKSVISGGHAFGNFDLGALVVEDSFPVTKEGTHKWRVQWRNVSETEVVDDFQVWAICAKTL